MGHVKVAWRNRRGVDLELMVLACDVDTPGVEVFDGVVGAMVAVWEARRGRPCRAAQDLVTQADAEQRDAARAIPLYRSERPEPQGPALPVASRALLRRPARRASLGSAQPPHGPARRAECRASGCAA